ncbi:MAG: alpha/beta fold hydrolase [Pseudomonadota bacterium]|nr:alpha/beta fold hydrolase [Pseudomonadota bacterium]
MMRFNEILIKDGILATYEIGTGPKLIFLHGGPGDTHHYLRPLAEKLKSHFTCILYDQRGSGSSQINERNSSTLSLSSFFHDLDSIIEFYGADRVNLFGHSWGAMLALFYNIARPNKVSKNAIVSIGPLTEKYGVMNAERRLSVLTASERDLSGSLRADRTIALKNKKFAEVYRLDNQLIRLTVKSWIYDPLIREDFLNSYFSEPPVDRELNKLVWESAQNFFDWNLLKKISNPVWLCSGSHDPNPPDQIKELESNLQNVETLVLEKCGHIPWIEKPNVFFEAIIKFLHR